MTKVRNLATVLLRRPAFERELDEELRFHFDCLVEEKVAAGMSESEARRAARMILGGETQIKESVRDASVAHAIDGFARHVRFGSRGLIRAPGFTLAAVITLALGIGATTIVFSVVHSMMKPALPWSRPENLVLVWGTNAERGQLRDVISGSNYVDLVRQNETFESLAAVHPGDLTFRDGVGVSVASSLEVTPGFLDLLGIRPLLGRGFRPGDEKEKKLILSYPVWRDMFGADPGVIGRTLAPFGLPHEIIGVLPEDFRLFEKPALMTTLDPSELEIEDRMHLHYWVVGRLRDGVSPAEADADLDRIMGRLGTAHPSLKGWSVTVDAMEPALTRPIRPALLTLLGAVAIVFFICCINVANLVLARGIARTRDIAVRISLGAPRGAIIRQLIVESALLALAGGLVGIVLSVVAVNRLHLVIPDEVAIADSAAMVALAPVAVDRTALLFTALVSGCTVLMFGFTPAMRAAGVQPVIELRSATRTTGSSRERRWRRWIVFLEIVLATILLVVAGLMLRSVAALTRVNPGFRPGNVLTMYVGMTESDDDSVRARFYDRVVDEVAKMPGVEAVALNDYILLQNEDDYEGFYREDRPKPAPGAAPREEWRRISPDYFALMRIPLVRGRFFKKADDGDAPSVVIVNQSMARKYWPEGDPIGKRLYIGHGYGSSEIVGVVADYRSVSIDLPAKPLFFVPYHRGPRPVMGLLVRSALPRDQLFREVRKRVASIDSSRPVYDARSLESIVTASMGIRKLTLWISSALASLAILLTIVGIYGVVSYSTARRTREIGIRVALGAGRGDIARDLFGELVGFVSAGAIAGLILALAASHYLRSQLYGVTPWDPVTLGVTTTLLLTLSCAAGLVPVRRALRVSPSTALRSE